MLPGDLQNQILACHATTTTTCRTRSRPSTRQHPVPSSSIYRSGNTTEEDWERSEGARIRFWFRSFALLQPLFRFARLSSERKKSLITCPLDYERESARGGKRRNSERELLVSRRFAEKERLLGNNKFCG